MVALLNSTASQTHRMVGLFGRTAAFGAGLLTLLVLSSAGQAHLPVDTKAEGRVGSSISTDGVRVRRATSMRSPSALADEFAARIHDADPGPAKGSVNEAAPAPMRASRCDEQTPLHVLFVGNSYTFYHGMPRLVADIANSAGCQLDVSWATNGGYMLSRHAEDPTTLAAIDERAWDVVVLQNQSQQPAFLPEDVKERSLPAVAELASRVYARSPSAQILYYSTWGRRDGDVVNCDYNPEVCTPEGHSQALERGYGIYADETGGKVVRVGHAFDMVRGDDLSPVHAHDLYDPDGSHPSLRGSYLAAATFFYELTGVSPEGLAFPAEFMAHEAAYLQGIAAMAVEKRELEKPGATVVTKEKLFARCDSGTCSDKAALDGAPARVTLFQGTCSDWYARTGVVEVARTVTSLACSDRGCATGRVDAWQTDAGEAVPAGSYSVFISLDADKSGGLTAGDVEACEDSLFTVGSGKSELISRFAPFDGFS